MLQPLQGVFAAVLTPFDAELAPDLAALANHCQWLLDNGCDGLAVLGTTGEANSLSVEERLNLIDDLAFAGIPGQTLIIGTGCCAIPDTVRLTRAALTIGAIAVLMLPPFYYKPVTDDGLFAAFAETIERVADRRLRVVLYHFPQLSGVPLPLTVIERLCAQYGPIIAGVKDSSGDLNNMQAIRRAVPELRVFTGADELLLPLLRSGGAGCITGLANIAAPLAAAVITATMAGTDGEAMAAQARLTALRKTFAPYSLIAALKAVLAADGDPRTWQALRPPLVPLDAAARAALFTSVKRLGLSLAAHS